MPYVKRTTVAGKTVEVEYYYTSRYNKRGCSRSEKVKATPEQQKKVNTRQAERKLRLLMNANFGMGDYHVILDYIRHKGEPDRTKEEMKKDIQVFLRECRKLYREAGISKPVYEYSPRCGAAQDYKKLVTEYLESTKEREA